MIPGMYSMGGGLAIGLAAVCSSNPTSRAASSCQMCSPGARMRPCCWGGRFAPVGAERPIIPNVLNSLIMTSLTMMLCLSISFGAAYVFSRFHFRPLRLLLSSLLIVRMTPGVSLAVPIFLLMLKYRLVDTYIGLSMVYTLTSLPLAIWLMKGFFDT